MTQLTHRHWYASFNMVEQEDGYMVYHPQK
jgi:hypothetical protein